MLKLAPACRCDKCSHACNFGSGILAEGDKEKIAGFLNISVAELEKNHLEQVEMFNKTVHRPKLERKGTPYGKCTFYDKKKGCTIHTVKPLQCKTSMGCKDYGTELTTWFYWNHVVDAADKESMKQWKAYKKANHIDK